MMIGSTACRVALFCAVLTGSASFIHLAIVEGIIILLDFVLPAMYIWRFIPEARFRLREYDGKVMRSILSYGGYVLLLQMGIRMSFMIDAQVIGASLPHRSVAHYSNANTFLIYLTELMVSLGQVVMPAASRSQAQGRLEDIQHVLLKWSRIALSMSLLVCLYLLAFGPEFVGVWMHDQSYVDPSRVVLPTLVLSCIAFLPIRAVALPMLMGLGLVKRPAVLFLMVGFLNLGLSIALVGPFGLFGVALGTAIPNVIYAALMVIIVTQALEMSAVTWLRYVFLKPMIGALIAGSLMFALRSWISVDSIPMVLLSGTICTAIFTLVWVLFVHRGDPYLDPLRMLTAR
jgi:O-antigen/teichoic acid export membrane protein